jgi:hypothetical protein
MIWIEIEMVIIFCLESWVLMVFIIYEVGSKLLIGIEIESGIVITFYSELMVLIGVVIIF